MKRWWPMRGWVRCESDDDGRKEGAQEAVGMVKWLEEQEVVVVEEEEGSC
jgi:hypothetical protein